MFHINKFNLEYLYHLVNSFNSNKKTTQLNGFFIAIKLNLYSNYQNQDNLISHHYLNQYMLMS
jgi:hypothetical protein